jgi:hypothetical protein
MSKSSFVPSELLEEWMKSVETPNQILASREGKGE